MTTSPEYAARRREVIRTHHPDVGGDPERLRLELSRLDREFGRVPQPASTFRVPSSTDGVDVRLTVRPSRPLRRLQRRTAAQIRQMRGRLPRSVPGSKRYFDI